MKLNLGCGRNSIEGFLNLDRMKTDNVDLVADVNYLPFKNDSINEFNASHLIEHLDNTLHFMQELHRVSKNGAIASFNVPYGSSDDADEDQTHKRRYFLHSFGYFSQPYYWQADYGYRGDWQPIAILLALSKEKYNDKSIDEIMFHIKSFRNIVIGMSVKLQSIKPIRTTNRENMKNPEILISKI
jgi:ubiquinone/menaquinone biosynthesis C-methylase UbiE